MKKILIFSLALCLYATGALATDSIVTSTTIGGGLFTPSKGVGVSITSSATGYAATSAHLSGTFEYGTGGGTAFTGDASKILQADIPSQSGKTVGTPDATTVNTGLPSATWK
jgi:hypothetical protein